MMVHKIFVHDLQCYKTASEEAQNEKLVNENRYFDLEKLPTEGLREEMYMYIHHRGEVLSLSSMRTEFWLYNILCRFLNEKYPALSSFNNESLDVMTRRLKKWLLNNGYGRTKKNSSGQCNKAKGGSSKVILYLRRIYKYLIPKTDVPEAQKDIWRISKLDFPVRDNPISPVHTLNFTPIVQQKVRDEVKAACLLNLTYLAARTVKNHLQAVKRFSLFLASEYPQIESLTMINRDILEAYLIYLNTEVVGKKSFSSELKNLKSLFNTIGNIEECAVLCNLFLSDDISKSGAPQYKAYSDQELVRLNAAIVTMDEQVARALILHQMLGTRISETLTLEQDCLVKIYGNWHVRAYQYKTFMPIYKPANEDVIKLIEASIQYTNEKYGKQKYIFVYDEDPSQPMRYGKIRYNINAMVQKTQLCDDEGKLFGVGTHIFRHSYGRKLAEMNLDDHTIARLLGHANTSSVKYYRKYGAKALADATRELRKDIDEMLEAFGEEW